MDGSLEAGGFAFPAGILDRRDLARDLEALSQLARERGATRFVMGLPASALATAAAQWFERTLDDSANRRLTLPEAFLALDGALEVMLEVTRGLVVYEVMIRRALELELPFLITEDLIGEAVRRGGDRQEAHETLRRHSQAAGDRVKREAGPNDLFERLRGEPAFAGLDFEAMADPLACAGRAPEQVDEFLEQVVGPIRRRWNLHQGSSQGKNA